MTVPFPVLFPGVKLPPWLAAVRNGFDSSTSAYVFIVGDSTTVGSQAGDAGDNVDAFKNSWPVVMRSLVQSDGINCRSDAWMAAAYGYATFADASAYRPALSFGASWAIDNRNSLSIRVPRDNSGTSDLVFTPEAAFDAIRIRNVLEATSSTAQFTVKVNGVTVATIASSTSGTPPGLGPPPRMYDSSYTGLTTQVQAITLNRVASDNRPAGVIPYNTRKSELILASVAASGTSTTQATTTQVSGTEKAYCMGFSGQYFARTWTIIMLGINDELDGVDPATTFRSNLAALQANHGAASPILWVVPYFIDPLQVPTETQVLFHDEIRAVAAANGEALLDLTRKFGTYDDMVASSLIDSDGVHINKAGQSLVAGWMWTALKST